MQYRDATIDDIKAIAANLRQSDIDELEATRPGWDILSALVFSNNFSDECRVWLQDNKPVGLYGVGGEGCLWFVATTEFKLTPTFHKHAQAYMTECLYCFPYLYNKVHRDNVAFVESFGWYVHEELGNDLFYMRKY